MEEFELELGETLTRTVHQHWFLLAARLVPVAILAWLPLIALPLLSGVASQIGHAGGQIIPPGFNLDAPLARFFLGLWWLALWIGAFTIITKYFLTMWVITSQRIVDISQDSLFGRQVSSFLLSRVQDITTDVQGLFPTLIGYGTLNVETAGRLEKFSMDGVAHPEGVRDLIMREIADLQNTDSLGTKVVKSIGGALL